MASSPGLAHRSGRRRSGINVGVGAPTVRLVESEKLSGVASVTRVSSAVAVALSTREIIVRGVAWRGRENQKAELPIPSYGADAEKRRKTVGTQ